MRRSISRSRMFSLAAACALAAGSASAAPATSANYGITASSVDVGGNRSASVNYTNGGCIGGIGGISTVASPAEAVKGGFEGQLYQVVGLAVNSYFVNNGTPQQLTATQSIDDGTLVVPLSSSLTWALVGGVLPPGLTLNSSTGVISGSPGGPTNYSFTISATDSLGNTAQQTFTPFATYAQWVEQFPNLTNSAPMATPENDGVCNLLKYLFDINPTQPMSPADRTAMGNVSISSVGTPVANYLVLTYRQNQALSGVAVNLQTSVDLRNWQTVTPDISQQISTDATSGDPIMEVGVLIAPGTQEQFIRLNVVQQ